MLSVYYAIEMVNENATTAVSSRFLIKGTTVHGVCPVFVVLSVLIAESVGSSCNYSQTLCYIIMKNWLLELGRCLSR